MRLPAWAVAGAAGALVYLAAPSIAWPARAMTALLIGVLPILMVAQLRVIGDPAALPRIPVYVSSGITLWVLAALALLAARASGLGATELGLRPTSLAALFAWSTGLTAAGIAIVLTLRVAGIRESGLLLHLLPETRRERILFVGLALTAGFCEELLFRGFLLATLRSLTASTTAAVAISTFVFGWMHAYQRPAGAFRAAALGAILMLPPVLANSLVPSVFAHALLDLLGGLWLRNRLAR
jgi:membrane protease YdiL (CAAX protease family)